MKFCALTNNNAYFRAALAGLSGALTLCLGIWLHQQSNDGQESPTLVFAGERLKLVGAEGEMTTEGLLIRRTTPGNPALVLTAVSDLEAEDYPRLSWDLSGLAAGQELALTWFSSTQPDRIQHRIFTQDERTAGFLTLDGDPAWRGQILQLGILLKDTLAEPLLFKSLTLQRKLPGTMDALVKLKQDWTHLEPWSQRSINFHIGAARERLLTPVTTVALWVGISFLLFSVISCPSSSSRLAMGFTILALTGWLVLDGRWQWQLGVRLLDTYESFGQLTPEERPGAAMDAKVWKAVEFLRRELEGETTRLFILHGDLAPFLLGRLRYHFLPHRSYTGLSDLPSLSQVLEGDHILVLSNLSNILFDLNSQRLVGPNRNLPVKREAVIPGFGALYRIRGED